MAIYPGVREKNRPVRWRSDMAWGLGRGDGGERGKESVRVSGGRLARPGGVRSETTRAGGSGFIGLPRGKPASAGTRTTRAGRGLGRLGRATADARDISGSTGGLPGGKGKSGGVGRRAGPDEEANAGGGALASFPTFRLVGFPVCWEVGKLAGWPAGLVLVRAGVMVVWRVDFLMGGVMYQSKNRDRGCGVRCTVRRGSGDRPRGGDAQRRRYECRGRG